MIIKEDKIMSMEISNNYSSYASSYTNTTDKKKKVAESSTTKEAAETGSTTKKTAADELAYLSQKYSNYSFVAVNYSKGMKYGSSPTVNVAISPQFLAKMANDPELEKEYEKNIAAMQECDEQFTRMQAARGWRVDAQGWAIDKDGGISSWAVVTKDPNAKSHLQTMSENAEKIRKQKDEKKKEKAEIEEKRQASREEKEKLQEKLEEAGKEQFGDKFKNAFVMTQDDEETDADKDEKKEEMTVGVNVDTKI